MSRRVFTNGGRKDKALIFNVTNQYIDIAGISYPNATNTTPVSISFWIYKTGGPYGYFFTASTTSAGRSDFIATSALGSGYQLANVLRTATGSQYANSGELNFNQWYNCVCTWDGTSRKIYIDAVLKNTKTGTDSYSDSFNRTEIGRWTTSFSAHILDEFQIFNKALSISEVQEIYNNGKPINPLSYSFVDSLVAAYPLGENDTFGVSGIENLVGTNGTAINMDSSNIVCGVESDIVECSSNALRFNGTNEDIDISSFTYPWAGGDSISLWFKTTYSTISWLFRAQETTVTRIVDIYMESSGAISYQREDNTAAARATSPTAYNDGNWHHLVGTWDGTTRRLYIDGVEVDTNNSTATITPSLTVYKIGSILSNYFKGTIDDVSVFSVALSQAEVDELYNNGVPLDATTHTQSANLSAYWKFTDSDTFGSNGILDSSGNANHGTATNMDSTNLVCGVDNDPQIICNSDEVLNLNPVLYLDRACSNFTVASGSAIGQWNDLSGNGYHATQSTASEKPILTPEGVQFDEVNDFMQFGSVSDFTFQKTFQFTIYIDFELTDYTDTSTRVYLSTNNTTTAESGWSMYTASNRQLVFGMTNSNGSTSIFFYVTANNVLSQNKNKIVIKANGNAASGGIWLNGSKLTLATSTSTTTTTNNHTNIPKIGRRTATSSSFPFNGSFKKIALWNSAITDQQAIDLST